MSTQTSLTYFLKQPSAVSTLYKSSSAVLNDPDLDGTENESKSPLQYIKLSTTILKNNKSFVNT